MAEASFRENGDTQNTRDEAYLALRKTEYAEVIARTRHTDAATGATVDAMHADEKKTVAGTSKRSPTGQLTLRVTAKRKLRAGTYKLKTTVTGADGASKSSTRTVRVRR